MPDKQIAAAFVWKATEHIKDGGKVCFVLPHGLIFNHSTKAVPFQQAWVKTHAIDCVLNLADLRFFLFEKAIHPAIVVRYQKAPPKDRNHPISYWAPKADWTVTKTEVITIAPQDRATFTVGDVLKDLSGPDAPQIWKRHFWATPRDWRLLDRLALYPRLRDLINHNNESADKKTWRIATGLRLFTQNDPETSRIKYKLPTRNFIPTTSNTIDLFLLEKDCEVLPSREIDLRRNHQHPEIFAGPHVLFTKGFQKAAFVDFDVAFLEAVRGIHGPAKDRDLLAFLAAYLRTSVAKYFLFHTSSNWGIYRPEIHLEEVLRVPFPLPDQQASPARSWEIVHEVARIVARAATNANATLVDRADIIRIASDKIEALVEEYFDVLPPEKLLIEDTLSVTINSIQPTQSQLPVATVMAISQIQLQAYSSRVCEMLNGWAKRGKYSVRGTAFASDALGVALAVFEKVDRRDAAVPMDSVGTDALSALNTLRKAALQKHNTLDLVRGVMAFSGNRLYVVKPIGQRQWTQTAAMNDADEIAGTILMRPPQENA